jgi:hypothetical protein
VIFACCALVISAFRWIGADDQKIITCRQTPMARASREDSDIACLYLDSPTFYPTKLHLALTTGNSQHFMDARVIVNIA